MKIVKNNDLEVTEQIKRDMQEHHEKVIAHLKSEHEQSMKAIDQRAKEQVHTAKRHTGAESKVLENGVIVQPGNYYVENGQQSFGISEEELSLQYSEVK